ncbi:MAG: transposase, partial [Richelia sp.]|nr:transposase [Richelia sp.]NRB08543.1 transposase [Richelia sp.]
MAGRFEGLSNLEWSLFEDIFPKPPEKREPGMPHSSF